MTYSEAVALHLRHINRQPVDADELAEAIRVIEATRRRPGEAKEEHKQ